MPPIPWKHVAIAAAALVATVAIVSLRGGGPIQGAAGEMTFIRTAEECILLMDVHTGSLHAGSSEWMFLSSDDRCYVTRVMGVSDYTGREGVSESIKAMGGAVK